MRRVRHECAPYGLRDAGAQDAEAVAQVLGDWCREMGWMPKLHTRDEDLWFAGHLIETQAVRLGFAGGGLGFLARQMTDLRNDVQRVHL